MKDQGGFSLIEVIVTIAIIGILGITLLEIFGASVTSVAKAGDRTENLYSLQEAMDETIRKVEAGEDVDSEVVSHHTVTVNGTDIEGKLITVTHKGESLTTFLANPKEDSEENTGDEN